MLEVYGDRQDRKTAAVIRRLDDLVLAYRLVEVASADGLDGTDKLPALKDGSRVVSGEAAIERYLVHLEKEKELWDRFQSDSCYVDDDGSVC